MTPNVSTGVEEYRSHRNVSDTTTSASANAPSGSPYDKHRSTTTFESIPSCSTGNPASNPSSIDTTAGNGSYSTTTNSAASSARYRSAATTATTGSPQYRTRSAAIA